MQRVAGQDDIALTLFMHLYRTAARFCSLHILSAPVELSSRLRIGSSAFVQ